MQAHDSWVTFYAAKAREPAGALQVLTKSRLFILLSDYANDMNKFKSIIAAYPQ